MQWATARSTRPKRAHDTRTITRLSRDHLLDIIARQHHYNITICMEMRRDLMHERCVCSRCFFSLLSTRFSRCCSIWESANLVAVVPLLLLLLLLWFLLLLLIVVLLLQLLLPLHVMLVVFVLLFFIIHNADF